MARESVIALDLEGTLISNAVSQFPRPGLYAFLEFCRQHFTCIYLYTAVHDEVCDAIRCTLVSESLAPLWFLGVPLVRWNRASKDLRNIPDVEWCDCLLVDDNRDYVVDDQLSQWIPVAKFESPYAEADNELLRVQQVIGERLGRTGRRGD
jgi:hypothetical protein